MAQTICPSRNPKGSSHKGLNRGTVQATSNNLCMNFLTFYVLLQNCDFASCFYGCETWSFTLRENENRLLGEISGHKSDEVTVQLRRLRNEELYDLYSAPHIIRVMKV